MLSARASQHVFLGVSALRFAASAAATIVWSTAMSGMGAMSMPSGFIAIAACPWQPTYRASIRSARSSSTHLTHT